MSLPGRGRRSSARWRGRCEETMAVFSAWIGAEADRSPNEISPANTLTGSSSWVDRDLALANVKRWSLRRVPRRSDGFALEHRTPWRATDDANGSSASSGVVVAFLDRFRPRSDRTGNRESTHGGGGDRGARPWLRLRRPGTHPQSPGWSHHAVRCWCRGALLCGRRRPACPEYGPTSPLLPVRSR